MWWWYWYPAKNAVILFVSTIWLVAHYFGTRHFVLDKKTCVYEWTQYSSTEIPVEWQVAERTLPTCAAKAQTFPCGVGLFNYWLPLSKGPIDCADLILKKTEIQCWFKLRPLHNPKDCTISSTSLEKWQLSGNNIQYAVVVVDAVSSTVVASPSGKTCWHLMAATSGWVRSINIIGAATRNERQNGVK